MTDRRKFLQSLAATSALPWVGIGETYISTGSLYLCTAGLLPLGLPPEDEFWTSPPQDWTAK